MMENCKKQLASNNNHYHKTPKEDLRENDDNR